MTTMTRILFLLLFPAALFAQADLSLSQALQTGLGNRLGIQIAENNVLAADMNNNWANAGKYPSVNFNFSSQNNYTDRVDPSIVFQPEIVFFSGSASGTLDMNWVLFNGYRVRITKNQLQELANQSRNDLATEVENTIRDIMVAYYQAQIQQAQVELAADVMALSSDRLRYLELRQDFGGATSFDLFQSRDAYLSDSTNLLIQQNALLIAFRNLNLAMGLTDLTPAWRLTENLVFDPATYALPDLNNRLLEKNIQLRTLRSARELARIQRELAEGARLPSLSMNTGMVYSFNPRYNGDAINPFTGEPLGLTVGRTFTGYINFTGTVPIFNGGVRKRAVETAHLGELNANFLLTDTERLLLGALDIAHQSYEQQVQVLSLAQARLENALATLDIAAERLRGGLISSLDYRAIQLSYLNAAQGRLQAYFNLRVSETELIRLTGGLVGE